MKSTSFATLVCLLVSLCLFACNTTRQTSPVVRSGFLSDYPRLEKDKTVPHWANANFKTPNYGGVVVFPPVEIWLSDEELREADKQELARLGEMFRNQAIRKLQQNGWVVTDEPAEGIASLRVALTEIESAGRLGNFIAGIPYMAAAATRAVEVSTGTALFVGKISVEVQFTDSVTGEILAEAQDRRVGAHKLQNIGSSWGDVEDAIDHWTSGLTNALTEGFLPHLKQ